MMLNLKKGDLVYLPADIMIFGAINEGGEIHDWIKLEEPSCGVMVSPNHDNENIYHKIHVQGGDWFVRTVDTMEVMSRA
jgi:hypothetical protein